MVNGLGIERAIPDEESILATETQTLGMAVDCVLGAEA